MDNEAPGLELPPINTPNPARRRWPAWLLGAGLAVAATVAALLTLGGFGSSALGSMVDLEGPTTAALHARAQGHGAALALPERIAASLRRVHPDSSLETVPYTIQSGGTLADLSRIFGMDLQDLQTLNPGVAPEHFMPPGASVLLYRRGVAYAQGVHPEDPERLYGAVPLPEGPGRRIRRRSRSWGTLTMIRSLDTALRRYAEAHPEGPVLIVSDLSTRTGGRLKPHHSHRQGRDADLSYVPRPEHDNGGFLLMDERTFDAARNWTFYKALLDTGEVEQILMDARLQRILREHAAQAGVPAPEVERLFARFQHWDGHRDHVHIRFKCANDDPYCR